MMNDPYGQRHQAQRAAKDADQAEFAALKSEYVSVDTGIYDDRVAGAFDDFDVTDPSVTEVWHHEDLRLDTAVGRTCEEIERRLDILKHAYPFKLDGGTLSYSSGGSGIYEFFLSICNSNTLASGRYVWLPRVFERIAGRLVASYFGTHARCIHTGWPRDPDVGTTFKEAMRTVSERTGEWQWGPEEKLPEDKNQGDEGCDFVVWLDAPDRRKIGQLFVLGQCACGDNWQDKYGDLNLKGLQKWFNPLSLIDPVRSFATPHHVTDALLREATRKGGLFFDRARLTMIAFHAGESVLDQSTKDCMANLIKLVLE